MKNRLPLALALRARMGAMRLGTRKFHLHDGYCAESEVEYLGLPEDRIWGAAGTDFFKGCSLGLNFRDREIWLAPARDPGEGVPHQNSRIFPTFSEDVNDTLLHGYYQRADALRTAGFKKKDTPVHVIETWDYLQKSISRDLGLAEDLVGIVGLETVLDFHTVIDFENDRILLFAYIDRGHLPQNRFNGFGFVLGPGSPLGEKQ